MELSRVALLFLVLAGFALFCYFFFTVSSLEQMGKESITSFVLKQLKEKQKSRKDKI